MSASPFVVRKAAVLGAGVMGSPRISTDSATASGGTRLMNCAARAAPSAFTPS